MEQRKWFKEMCLYQVWPRSFKDGNGDGVGDLKGVLEKLDYIASLGVDAIWFSPLYPSPQADFGYDIADYTDINPEYGTLDDFRLVLKRAHELGLKVIMDLVINHTSDRHIWFEKSKKRIEPYTDYYIWRKGRGKDGKRPPNNWLSTFPGSAWEYCEERGEFYLHLYAKQQPDLNHDNPLVREEIEQIMRFWLDMGVDGFREDVITQISKAEGLPNGKAYMPVARGVEHYSNGPHIHQYLAQYRQVLKEYDAVQIGEAPMIKPKQALEYTVGDDRELDMLIGFEHMEADCFMVSWLHHRFDLRKLKRTYERWQTELYGKGWNANYIENHDQPRVISRYGDEKRFRVESGKALCMMYAFLSGTQFVYQGQEIGMTSPVYYVKGQEEPWAQFSDVSTFCVRDLMKKLGVSEAHILKIAHYAARDAARTPMQWSANENADFGGKPWTALNPNYTEVNVEAAERDENSLLNFYRRIIALRKQYKEAAIYGKFELKLKSHPQLFVYDKLGDDGSKLTVVLNLSGKPVKAFKLKSYVDEGAKLVASVYADGPYANLRPYEGLLYVTEGQTAKNDV